MQKFQKMEHSNSRTFEGLLRTFKDLLCFQGLSRAWNFFFKIQGLSRTSQGPYEPWLTEVPIIVCVFPDPVWPYANTQAL